MGDLGHFFNDHIVKDEPCQLARVLKVDKVSKMLGEEIEDDADLDMEEDEYEEQVRFWLRNERAAEVQQQATNFPQFLMSDDFRSEEASPSGGFQLVDDVITERLRTAGSALISKAASAAWAGNFKLSSLPFPIKASHGRTELQTLTTIMMSTMPIYFNAAAASDDPVERMKFVIASSVSHLYQDHSFEKPVESLLGETVQGHG